MTPCHAVEFVTPKGFLLRGLLFGTANPVRVIIWVHGLGGSLFSNGALVRLLARGGTAVLVFNNRGHDMVSRTRHATKDRRVVGGAACEVFTDCVDDIEGAARFARTLGGARIFLAGHSTGCQKAVYWAYKKKSRGVKGIILLAPVSDYASARYFSGAQKLARAGRAARALIRAGKKQTFLPESVWDTPISAQRFLSLYTPDSSEEIFSYAQHTRSRALAAVRVPILVLWAQEDEYADRPVSEVLFWFKKMVRVPRLENVQGATHGFREALPYVAGIMKEWIHGLK